jgi:hypothetical protein
MTRRSSSPSPTFSNTSDDAVNVHGFYYYVIQKAGSGRYLLSPKWDKGLVAGDEIETCEHGTFRSLGRTRIMQLMKRKSPELQGKIAPPWKNKSPTTEPDLVYDVVLQHDLPLKTGDSVTSLTRIGAGTAIRRCSFHACGRVLVKSPNSLVDARGYRASRWDSARNDRPDAVTQMFDQRVLGKVFLVLYRAYGPLQPGPVSTSPGGGGQQINATISTSRTTRTQVKGLMS